MGLINCSFESFVNGIQKQNKKIICYGAGMLPLYAEPLLRQYDLVGNIEFFVDGDPEKTGKMVFYTDSSFKIRSPQILKTVEQQNYVILIMIERYNLILRDLADIVNMEKWDCYAYPLLNSSYFNSKERNPIVYGCELHIPKTIHYVWFGKKEKDKLHQYCIDSWKDKCPEYEIVEWNESNYDVRKNKYTSQAFEKRKWAYVSDYARLDILYRYGGVYLDTDVELLKPIDKLLYTEAFICYGEWPAPNSGAGIGCIPNNNMIREMMETRENIPFIQKNGVADPYTNSNYEENVLLKYGFSMNFDHQVKNGMAIYPPDIIAPISVVGKDTYITERTIGIHYCNNSWRNTNE